MSEIGSQIRELRVRGGLTQRQLAARSHISHSYVGLLETGRRRPERDTLIAIGTGLGLDAAAVSELLRQAGHEEPGVCEELAKVRRILNAARAELPEPRETCFTFYVRDPYWPDELRLVDMLGVNRAETMHGFLSPDSSKQVLQRGDSESFCKDVASAAERRDNSVRRPDSLKPELLDYLYLFGDFVERENIKSSARFVERENIKSSARFPTRSLVRKDDSAEAVLFVNFRTTTDFSPTLKQHLRDLWKALIKELPAIEKALSLQDAPILQQAMTMLRPVQDWAAAGITQGGNALRHYFESTLDAAMAAVCMSIADGVGTIHLYDAENERLELAAYRGSVNEEKLKSATVQMVSKGEGIISWVALRERAIVISDLADDRNPFRKLHVPIRDDVRSEIAVPMLAGTLVGVLNLE